MAYPKIDKIEDATSLKITTKNHEIQELKSKTKKHDYDNSLKSLKVDIDDYKMKYESLKNIIIYL